MVNKCAIILVWTICLNCTNAYAKKIELEDIEEDNLKSERTRENKDNIDIHKIDYSSSQNHQYDVEENTPDTSSPLYYTSKNNQYSNGETYEEVDVGQQSKTEIKNHEYQYQNSIENNVNNHYGAVVPMQIVFVPQYNSLPLSHINTYGTPNLYYQTQHYEKSAKFSHSHSEKNAGDTPIEPSSNVKINYLSIPLSMAQVPGYVLKYEHEHLNDGINISPQIVNNYIDYNDIYSNQPLKTQDIKYVPVTTVNHNDESIQSNTYKPKISIISTSHIPQVLPQYAHIVSRPVYSHISGNLVQNNPHTSSYNLDFSQYVKRKPSSLLESYIPSSIQVEYLKRGLSKDPLSTYDTIANSKGFPIKNFETGFLPNQMYPTAEGGVVYH